MKKFASVVAAAAISLLALGTPAQASPYPPGGQQVTIDDAAPAAGGPVVVTAACTGDETVTITLGDQTATTTCEDGTATVTINAPSTPGAITGVVLGATSGPLGEFEVTVAAQVPVTTPSTGLPATGSSGVGLTAGLAVGLLVVGLGLFVAATVRRRQPAA